MDRSIPSSNTRGLDRLSKRILLEAGRGYPASDAELWSQVSDARHWNYCWYVSAHSNPLDVGSKFSYMGPNSAWSAVYGLPCSVLIRGSYAIPRLLLQS